MRWFKGRKRFLHEDGIYFSSSLPNYVIDSEDDNQAIHGLPQNDASQKQVRYGSAACSGGCIIRRSLSVLVLAVYSGQGDRPKDVVRDAALEVIKKGF